MHPTTSTTTRSVVTLATIVVALSLAACSGSAERDTTTTTGPPTTSTTLTESPEPDLDNSAYGQLLALADDNSVDEATLALTKFAAYFGPVPGALDIVNDGSLPATATGAVEAVSEVRTQLSEEQRVAVAERLRPFLLALESGPSASAQGQLIGSAGDGPTTVRAASFLRATADEDELRSIASWAEGEIESRLGGNPLVYSVTALDADPPQGEGTTTPIVTLHPGIVEWVYDLLGIEPERDVSCEMLIGPTFRARDASALRSGIAHEMFHCWSISQGLAGHLATPKWYQEGVASWIGEDLVGGSSYSTNWWHFYMTPAQLDITRSEYPAIGFWSWVDEQGGNLWAQIPELHAIASAGNSGALYSAVTQAFDNSTFSGLAGARMRDASLGPAWTMTGPGIASRHTTTPGVLSVGAEQGAHAPAGAIAVEHLAMPPTDADTVLGLVVEGAGAWRALWSNGTELTSAADPTTVRWCLAEPCVCPNGVTNVGWDPLPPDAGTLLLTASAQELSRSSVVASLVDLCPEDEPPPDDPGSEPGDLVGVWEATPSAMVNMFERIFAESEIGSLAGPVGGTVVLIFNGDGMAELRYVNVVVPIDSAGLVADLGINGGGTLTYRVDGSTITFTGTDVGFTFTLLGQEIDFGPDDIPLGASGDAIWGVDSGTLTLQTESVDQSLPNQWRRNE